MNTLEEQISLLKASGYHQLTDPYLMPVEEEEFECAKAQLNKHNPIPFVCIWYSPDEVAIWSVPVVAPVAEDQ